MAFWHEDKRLPDANLPITKRDGHTKYLRGITIELTTDSPKLVVSLQEYKDVVQHGVSMKTISEMLVFNIRKTTGVTIQLDLIRSVRREAGYNSGRLISTDLILGFLSPESDQTDLIIFEKKKMLGAEWSGEDEGRKIRLPAWASPRWLGFNSTHIVGVGQLSNDIFVKDFGMTAQPDAVEG